MVSAADEEKSQNLVRGRRLQINCKVDRVGYRYILLFSSLNYLRNGVVQFVMNSSNIRISIHKCRQLLDFAMVKPVCGILVANAVLLLGSLDLSMKAEQLSLGQALYALSIGN